ncbi:Holliday junction branch migration DNA helicase RuvB, partial [Candidatus Collierbacteria bacterium]|nr:Holliday junction branch migration DNA helicase RuvB [Candidatus Collierbacteria bacterium]
MNQSVSLDLRARDWSEFTGQQQVVESLKIAIKAAKSRKETLDHVL